MVEVVTTDEGWGLVTLGSLIIIREHGTTAPPTSAPLSHSLVDTASTFFNHYHETMCFPPLTLPAPIVVLAYLYSPSPACNYHPWQNQTTTIPLSRSTESF